MRTQVPLGDPTGEGTDDEKRAFDLWLRERWGEKDRLMAHFVETGAFLDEGEKIATSKSAGSVQWPLELRAWWETLGAFSYFTPLFLLWLAGPIFGVSVVGFLWQVVRDGGKETTAKAAGCGCAAMKAAAAKATGEL